MPSAEERAALKQQREQSRAEKAALKLAARRRQYVRVTDEFGEFWTIPPGSWLHQALQQDEDEGYKTHSVPIHFCRDPHLPAESFEVEAHILRLEQRFTAAQLDQVRSTIAGALARVREWAGFVGRFEARARLRS